MLLQTRCVLSDPLFDFLMVSTDVDVIWHVHGKRVYAAYGCWTQVHVGLEKDLGEFRTTRGTFVWLICSAEFLRQRFRSLRYLFDLSMTDLYP